MESKNLSNVSGGVVVSKAKISQFVHDAAELEKKECILNGVAKELDSSERFRRINANEDVLRRQGRCRTFREALSAEEAKLNAAKQELAKAEENRRKLFTKPEHKNPTADDGTYDEYGVKLPAPPTRRRRIQ